MKNRALIFTILSVLLFVLIQDEHWLLGWDFLDMIFLTLLLIGIDRKWNVFYFTGLFIVALFNRETALFIPLWMFLDAFSKKDRKKIGYSIVLAMIGIAVIYLLRENFYGSYQFYKTHSIYTGLDTTQAIYGNHFWLMENLSNPISTFPPWKSELSLIPLIMIVITGYFTLQWRSLNITNKNIVLLMISMVILIFTTAVIHETRTWFILIPYIIYLMQNIRYEIGK